MPLSHDPDARSALMATFATAAFVAIPLYVAPALANAYIGQLHFRADQPGYVISAEMTGMGLATFPAWWWVRRIAWNRLAFAMVFVMALGAALSALATTPWTLATVRFVTGLAAGTVSIVCMSALRRTRNPNRSFGIWMLAQLAVGGLTLAALPALLGSIGVAGFFATLAVLSVVVAWPARAIASGHNQTDAPASGSTHDGTAWSGVGVAGLAAILCFYVAFGALWTYVGQMAQRAGLSSVQAGYALSLGPIGGMMGAATAGALGSRIGRILPLAFGMATFSTSVYVVWKGAGLAGYSEGSTNWPSMLTLSRFSGVISQ